MQTQWHVDVGWRLSATFIRPFSLERAIFRARCTVNGKNVRVRVSSDIAGRFLKRGNGSAVFLFLLPFSSAAARMLARS